MHVDDEVLWRSDGTSFPAEYWSYPESDKGVVVGAVVTFLDISESKRLKETVDESRNLLLTIIDAIPMGVYWKDRNLRYLGCNKIFARDARIAHPQDVISKNDYQMDWTDQALHYSTDDLAVMESGITRLFYDALHTTLSGNSLWLRSSKIPLRNQDNEVFGLLGIYENITQRKKDEESQLKAGALQSAIFNSANFSSIATDAKGVIQIFNVGAERMLGYAAPDVLNKITPADISDPEEIITRAQALTAELETPIAPGFDALVFKASRGIEDIYELTYIRKDGSRFPAVVSVTALRDAQNAIIGYLLIGTDNTARKQAEEALLQAGALQSAIFNSANFSSIATDAKGVIQIFNVGAERMLGYAAADVLNKITTADISDPEEIITRAQALTAELETPIAPGFDALVFKASRGIEDIYELTYIRKDGSRFPAVVSVTALRDAQNVIIGYLLIGTDNTARKQIEAEQKQLEQRLRDHQFYTRSLFEANIDALMTTDPEQAEASINQVLSKKKVTDYELIAFARDGKKTVVSLNATTFFDRDRKLRGVFVAARDITERKRMQDDLARREAEMRTTLYSIGDAVISLDINGCVLLMNPVAEQLTGWSEPEAHGKTLEEVFCLINEKTRAKIDNPVTLVLNSGCNAAMMAHTVLIARDGTERPIGDSAAPIFDQAHQLTGVVLVFRDLTKERAAEEVILYQLAIIETYQGLVALADLDGKLIYINAGGTKLLGATQAEEILTKNMTDLLEPTDFNRVIDEADEALPVAIKERVWNGEHTLKRMDGTRIPVSQTVFPIRDAQGNLRHIGMIITDISQQKALQEKLLISEKLAVMGRLVADVSHEINNPLAIIIGRIQLMLSQSDGQQPPLQCQLETLLQNAQRCKTILSNLLTYSRTISKQEAAVNLPDLIREALDAVSYQYDMSTLEVAVACNLPAHTKIIANKDALLSVFINLIRNARQAMTQTGKLTITVAFENESQIRIEIHDTGIGISKSCLEKIFQPFNSEWQQDKGTGLGLVTSLGIIETHGGKLWAESAGEGQGTKFIILLPHRNRKT